MNCIIVTNRHCDAAAAIVGLGTSSNRYSTSLEVRRAEFSQERQNGKGRERTGKRLSKPNPVPGPVR
jgi:hypothetical protein